MYVLWREKGQLYNNACCFAFHLGVSQLGCHNVPNAMEGLNSIAAGRQYQNLCLSGMQPQFCNTAAANTIYCFFFVEKLDQRPKFEVKSMHVRKKSVTSNLPDDGTGTVQVFRVKGFNLEELPEKSHGVFYSGDCYVILYTYLKNGRERHIIYFWLVRTLFKTFLNILIAEVLDCQQEWQSVLMV